MAASNPFAVQRSVRLLLAIYCWQYVFAFQRDDAPALLAESPYGIAVPVEANCLTSGALVSATGRRQWCLDVPEAAGQKLDVSVRTARHASEAVRIGEATYLRAVNVSGAVGAIIEVRPFQQPCDRCDVCPCIGCGHRCECSCNTHCRLRQVDSCSHTAGVLSPGRWFVGVDAPGDFVLRATLVAALALRAGERLPPRTLWGAGSTQMLMDEGASEGASTTDYFFYDPAPREKTTLTLTLLRGAGTVTGAGGGAGGVSGTSGGADSGVDVYVRFGAWPTTELHDATMRCDQALHTVSSFVLHAERLLNERLCILVVARGDASVQYQLATTTETSGKLLGALLVVGFVAALVLAALLRIYAKRSEIQK